MAKSVDEITRIMSGLHSLISLVEGTKNQFMDFRECCDYLKLRPSTLYKLTRRGKIKSYKPNHGRLYYIKSEVDSYVRGC